MSYLKLFVFGQPRLEVDGKPIELNLRKALALLVYLAVSGQPYSRDALSTMLWPESDAREGRARLRRTLHRLQHAIGDNILDSGSDVIRLAPHADLWLDSAAFRQQVTAGLTKHKDTNARLAHLQAAVELYAEDFLAGFTLPDSPAYDEWQFFGRESLRQLYGQALEQLVQTYRAQQAWEDAVAYGRRWLALDALHEPAHRMLMRLYAWSGQHSAALRQYQECVRILDAELGIEPEQETTALYEAIRTRQLRTIEANDRPMPTLQAGAMQPHQRYLSEEHIATGGQGAVFRGRDRVTGQPVAIKWLRTELADQHPELVARFAREGAALRRLNHPNIVGILDTFEHDGRYAIVMDYVPGGSLRAQIERTGQLPSQRVRMIGLELADALSRAHHLGIVHCDLKPENVLLAADGTPRLTDFGMARWKNDRVTLTQEGTLIGSPAYMSPEAVRGEDLDARSDVWSLGVLLFELLAGRRPFDGAQITPVLASILGGAIPNLRQYRPDVLPAFQELIGWMLLKDRSQRLPSMRQVAAALEAIEDGFAPVGSAPQQPAYELDVGTVAPAAAAQSQADTGNAISYDPAGAAQPFVASLPADASENQVFVAREQELGRLATLLDATLAERNQIAFVVGEAGQGKTALLRAFALQAAQAHPELIVVGGNCNAYTGAGDPYLPFREILELLTGDVEARALAGSLQQEHATRLRELLPAAAQALVDVGPDLLDTFLSSRRLLGRAATYSAGAADWLASLHALAERKASAPARLQQQALFEQYARVLQALARHTPLLLILDDLQWADPGSADLLLHLGRRLQGQRVLIVGAYRPADVAQGRGGQRHPLTRVVGELQRDFGEIVLDLSRAEGRAFVDALLNCELNGVGESFRAALYQQTGGHPLFTIELIRDMRERGELTCDSSGCWAASPDLHWPRLPARVEGAIGERIGRLDARLRELLQVASVEGEEFTAEVVARVLGVADHEIVRLLSRELDQRHRLVRALGVRREDGVRLSHYRFQHILIQRYLYASMDEVELVYWHEAVGHALERCYGTQVAEVAAQLARHFEAAQLASKAAEYNNRAGDRARRVAALAEAIGYYQAALDAWPQSDPGGQAHLLRKRGECQWMLGHLQDALASFEACYSQYDALRDWQAAGAAQRLIGRMYWEQGDRERSLRHYYQALALLEAGPESAELAWAISSISQMHMLASANEQAIAWGQRALDMAERLGAEDVAVHALANIGSAGFGSGDAECGRTMLRRSWQRAVELHLPHDACRAANNLGVSLVYYGMPVEARAVFEELLTYAVRMQIHLNAGLALVSLIKLDWLTGRWQSALTRREELLAWISQGQSSGYLEVLADTMFAWMHNDLGQASAARRLLDQAQLLVADRAEIHTTGPHLGQQVRAFGFSDCEDQASAAARQFLQLTEQQVYWDTCMSHLVVCRWFALRAMGAELLASLARIERADAHFRSPATAAALSEARGIAALSEGREARAVAYLQQAAAHWQALEYPYHQAQALAALGRALLQSGAADAAAAAFDRALHLLEPLAAQLDDAAMRAAFLASPLIQDLMSFLHPATNTR